MIRVPPVATTLLRTAAIVIALVGAVDPAITSARSSKPAVAVIAADARGDSALADRVAGELSKRFTVYRAPFAGADATVLVGDRLPDDTTDVTAPAFAIVNDRTSLGVELTSVRAPSVAPAGSRVPVDATARVTGARGRTVDFTLRAGSIVVDRVTRTLSRDDERVSATFTHVPSASGPASLRVSATVAGAPIAAADVAVDVRDERAAVLFDPRPSWISTFVRRAVERDPRFVVTSRVVTSRSVSTDAGQPPARLDDLAALKLFDAVVVGAPEALSDADVAGLDAFMRRRGGSVVLLLDRYAPGPYDRLVGVDAWSTDSGSHTVTIAPVAGDTNVLRASEFAVPRRLPAAATALALTAGARVDSLNGRMAIWRAPVGAGRLVVSGALDAWRYRDRSVSGFDRFWQTTIADAASAAPPPIAVSISRPVARPSEDATLSVMVRDAALSTAAVPRSSVDARIESDSAAPVAVRLWPSGAPGAFSGTLRAPAANGIYRVVVNADGARAELPLIVSGDASRPMPDDRDVVDAWVRARGGRSLSLSQLQDLQAALTAAPRAETWHPMRSAWWIVPFALMLSAEWWVRRRTGSGR